VYYVLVCVCVCVFGSDSARRSAALPKTGIDPIRRAPAGLSPCLRLSGSVLRGWSGLGSVRCAGLLRCIWTRCCFDSLTEPSPVSASLPHPGSSRGGARCTSGSFRCKTALANHRRSSKAWPNIEERGRGGNWVGGVWAAGGGREQRSLLQIWYYYRYIYTDMDILRMTICNAKLVFHIFKKDFKLCVNLLEQTKKRWKL